MPDRPPRELDGLTAVVTGSTSGIGRAVALELATAGAAVLVHGRSSSQAAEAVAEEIRRAGSQAAVVMADLADPARHPSLVEQAWAWRGEVDIWMNNAGADVLTGEAAKWPFERKLRAPLASRRDSHDAAGQTGGLADEGARPGHNH